MTVQRVFDTNVFGPVRVVHAFAELLDASRSPVLVMDPTGGFFGRDDIVPW